jgi:hypothetical protein
MRDDVMLSLIDRAMNEAEFRQKALANLEGTLQEYGYDLSPDEMAAVREFQAQTAGKSSEEIDAMLSGGGNTTATRRQFPGGQ